MEQERKQKAWLKLPAAVIGIGLLVALDQWTKQLARTHLKPSGTPYVIWQGVFEFLYSENTGAVWGILQGQTFFLTVITAVILLLLFFAYIRIPFQKHYAPVLCINLFIIAGAIGNFIDRLINHYVTDFMYIRLINFPIFNIADMYVSISAVVMLILAFTVYREEEWAFFSIKKAEGAEN